jgi:hypothetical protein
VNRFGIWRVTIKHPRYVTQRLDVEASTEAQAIDRVRVRGRKLETYKARFLRGPKQPLSERAWTRRADEIAAKHIGKMK